MPLSPSRQAPSLPNPSPSPSPLLQHDRWLKHLATKYGLPRAVLARQLSPRGAFEYEIGMLVAELATRTAHTLFTEGQPPPVGADMFDRAVRAVYQRLQAAREAAEEAERQARYAESNAAAERMRAEQQQQTGEQS